MSKSIHIIGSRLLGGAESFYMRLVTALNSAGNETFAINRKDSLVARELEGKVRQGHASMSNQWDIISRYKINQFVKQEQPQIVQTYMTRATVLTKIKPNTGVVHIARLGGYYKAKRFANAHAWVGNTKGICNFLIENGMPANKVFYIGNFVSNIKHNSSDELAKLREELAIPQDAYVVTAMGRLTHKKGFDTLLSAFALVPPEIHNRPVHLVIAGDGSLFDDLKQQTEKLKLSGRVHWAGWQTVTSPYYNLADIFVCPSRHEPLGNVILEGWAHKRAVISTETLGANELATPNQNALLVPVDDVTKMAQAMTQALGNETMRSELAQAGFEYVNQHFTQQAIVRQYSELYQQLAI